MHESMIRAPANPAIMAWAVFPPLEMVIVPMAGALKHVSMRCVGEQVNRSVTHFHKKRHGRDRHIAR